MRNDFPGGGAIEKRRKDKIVRLFYVSTDMEGGEKRERGHAGSFRRVRERDTRRHDMR